ncbi:MAG: F0F1 ATP synthase subunit delta [Bacteroidales bacterium]|nr:F0F1 ATP synthase subunit delta [Bacteroidales bacterium]
MWWLKTDESFLPAIARVFIYETLKHKGITKSVLTTAVAVDEKVKARISAMISDIFKTKVELEEVIDSEIIGALYYGLMITTSMPV